MYLKTSFMWAVSVHNFNTKDKTKLSAQVELKFLFILKLPEKGNKRMFTFNI